jgi:hypothetical protein
MIYLEHKLYGGPVTVCKRAPVTGQRLSETEVMPGTIKAQLRSRPDQVAIDTQSSIKAKLASEWSQWRADRQARFEREAGA